MLKVLFKPDVSTAPPSRRRPRPLPLALIYPKSQPESHVQAETLLAEIQEHAEDTVGKYVPMRHLERFYWELAERKGWAPRHWSAIRAQLGRLTDKAIVKRGGKWFMAYRIPPP